MMRSRLLFSNYSWHIGRFWMFSGAFVPRGTSVQTLGAFIRTFFNTSVVEKSKIDGVRALCYTMTVAGEALPAFHCQPTGWR